ncbi:MAG: hypothetical protein WA580_08155, partial [Acidimicrobiales bacterium]
GKWSTPVTVIGGAYLLLMLLNIVWPSSLTSGRGVLFNYGWITLLVMVIIVVIGALYEALARPDKKSVDQSVGIPETAEATGVDGPPSS